MARDDESRLFGPEDLLSREELAADAEGAQSPAAAERDRDLDAAHMWISKDDGLLVRGVKPHSAQKSTLVSRGVDTVSSAMSGKWFAVKHGVHYVELYSGPGRLLDESTGVEQPGSPMRALSVRKPFTHYVLSDFSQGCVDALSARVGTRSDVEVVCGDANGPDHLERVAGLLNPKALVVAYLDPARGAVPQPSAPSRASPAERESAKHCDDDQCDPPALRRAAHGPRIQEAGTTHDQLPGGQSVLRHPARLTARPRRRPVEQDEPVPIDPQMSLLLGDEGDGPDERA